MLHKVKLAMEELFMVNKGLNFTENIKRQTLLKIQKLFSMVLKGLDTYKLNHTITKLNQ